MLIHIAIPVRDLKTSRSFYAHLGFTVTAHWERPEKNLRAVKMDNGSGMQIELVHHPDNSDVVMPKIPEVLHIGIEVQDLTATLAVFADAGYDVIISVTNGITVRRFAFLKDPNGFPVELFEM